MANHKPKPVKHYKIITDRGYQEELESTLYAYQVVLTKFPDARNTNTITDQGLQFFSPKHGNIYINWRNDA